MLKLLVRASCNSAEHGQIVYTYFTFLRLSSLLHKPDQLYEPGHSLKPGEHSTVASEMCQQMVCACTNYFRDRF